MKERPILFSAPMVRAILDGRKTVTRRMVKGDALAWLNADFSPGFVAEKDNYCCPFGYAGDVLWVKEPLHRTGWTMVTPGVVTYTATGDATAYQWKWKNSGLPGMFCPREISRISLEITEVRVQRLQDISEDEVVREGARWHDFGRECGHLGEWRDVGECREAFHRQRDGWTMEPPAASAENCLPSARMAFANLINKINGPETWDANPWVWCVSFEMVKR